MRELFESIEREKIKLIALSVFISSLLTNYQLIIHRTGTADCYMEGDVLYRNADFHLSLGRWATRFINRLTFNSVNPLLNYFVSLICIVMTVYLVTRLFKIKEKYKIVFCSVVLAICKPIILQYDFIYMLNNFSVGMLFSTLAAYLFIEGKKKTDFVIGIIILSLALGLYQAYIGQTVVLVVMHAIFKLLKGENVKPVVGLCFKCAFFCIVGCLLYLFFLLLNMRIFAVDMNSYGGANNIGLLNSLSNITKTVSGTYIAFFELFYESIWTFSFYIPLILLFVYEVMNSQCGVNNKILGVIGILCIPIFANIIYIIAPERRLYAVMLFQDVLIIPFILSLIKTEWAAKPKTAFTSLSLLCLSFLCLIYTVRGYSTQYSRNYCSKIHSFYAQNILNRALNEYDIINNKMVFAGVLDNKTCIKGNELYSLSYEGANSVCMDTIGGCLTGWRYFIIENLGFDIGAVSDDEYLEIVQSEEFEKMSVFPNENSIGEINGIVVVKLEERPPLSNN